jgi:hypothetical protein
MHNPDKFSTLPMALIPAHPFRVLHSPQIMPGLYCWSPVVEAKASAFYTGEIFAAKDHIHTRLFVTIPRLETPFFVFQKDITTFFYQVENLLHNRRYQWNGQV